MMRALAGLFGAAVALFGLAFMLIGLCLSVAFFPFGVVLGIGFMVVGFVGVGAGCRIVVGGAE